MVDNSKNCMSTRIILSLSALPVRLWILTLQQVAMIEEYHNVYIDKPMCNSSFFLTEVFLVIMTQWSLPTPLHKDCDPQIK